MDDGEDWEASNVVRVIIAGNFINSIDKAKSKTTHNETFVDYDSTLEAVKKLDNFVMELSKSIPVDLMPGEFDPTNHMLPQQPLHNCMFPTSGENNSFQCVPNPYSCEVEGRVLLGTAGQNVHDIERYSKIDDSLEALKSTLQWSHVLPTGPDTLPCYPYYEKDPFVINECPHVYYAGNCTDFQTELYERSDNNGSVRLICVPSFTQTQSVAVVNLRTLEVHKLCFKLNYFDENE